MAAALFALSQLLVGVGRGSDLSSLRIGCNFIVSYTVLFGMLNFADISRIEWPKATAPMIWDLIEGVSSFLLVLGG